MSAHNFNFNSNTIRVVTIEGQPSIVENPRMDPLSLLMAQAQP